MTRFDLNNDEVLLSLLSEAIDEADPVPSAAAAAAKAVARLQDIDAELAIFVADSRLDEEALLFRHDLTMARSGQQSDRIVSFATPQIGIDLEVQGDGRTIVGVITPPLSAPVDLETTSGSATTTSDDLGRFHLASGPGPCRLRIHVHDGAVITPWITR
ncbi:MAG: hypothetical protein QOK39_2612 [Acidimicrobiaceae bacterium]|nr:hypothetical protein [Acidimicrobiaceae bacterium]